MFLQNKSQIRKKKKKIFIKFESEELWFEKPF